MTPVIFSKYLFTTSAVAMLWLLSFGIMPSSLVAWFSFVFFVLCDLLVIVSTWQKK